MYVQTESEIQKQTESVILDQARVTKREAHTTGSRTRLLSVGGSWLERADPGNLHRSWPKPLKEQTYLREVGVLVLVAQPSDSSAGSPEKVPFCLRKTGIPGLYLERTGSLLVWERLKKSVCSPD